MRIRVGYEFTYDFPQPTPMIALLNVHYSRVAGLESPDHLMRIIDRIIAPLGRRIDESQPYQDARLPDGSRVNAVIRPVAIDGPAITIRKFKKDKLTLDKLVQYGSIDELGAELTGSHELLPFDGQDDAAMAALLADADALVSGAYKAAWRPPASNRSTVRKVRCAVRSGCSGVTEMYPARTAW